MRLCISWTAFLRVSTDAKCDKAIEKIRAGLGLPFDVDTKESYWKDRQLYKVLATTCIEAASSIDGFYSIMKALSGVARLWTVNGPSEDGAWEFSGTTSTGSEKIQEVDSISFSTIESNQNQARESGMAATCP